MTAQFVEDLWRQAEQSRAGVNDRGDSVIFLVDEPRVVRDALPADCPCLQVVLEVRELEQAAFTTNDLLWIVASEHCV